MIDEAVCLVSAPDVSWVSPALAIGGRFEAAHVPLLAGELAIRAVVDLRAETCDDADLLARHGLAFLHLPTDDCCAVSHAKLTEGAAWVARAIGAGGRVLVHCQHGIGRSALLACCVLVRLGDSPAHAVARAKASRAKVSPSPEQLAALLAWSAAWCEEVGRPPPSDSASDLAAIAYRTDRVTLPLP